jgi:outer membrane lipoprotein SlyB
MKIHATVSLFTVLASGFVMSSASAGVFGASLGGALRGAIVGDLIDGRDGAAAGAVIGGLIGAGEAAAQKKKQEESRQRQAEWEASQQAEQERIRQQQAEAAPEQSAAQTLRIETQKSLIRLGYDPGEIGEAGPALTDAVMQYQSSKQLLETGELSQALLTHMLRNGG